VKTDAPVASSLPRPRVLLLFLLGIPCLAWTQFAWVRATNFEGVDEWLVLSLASRGIVDVPHAHRPLGLLWNRIPALLAPHDLGVIFVLFVSYLGLTGALVALLHARLVPSQPVAALLAGSFTVLWAPTDPLRLAALYSTPYAGVCLGTALAIWLLVESWVRERAALLVAALALLVVDGLVYEGSLPLLLAAPLLLTAVWRGRPSRWKAYLGCWLGLAGLLAGRVGLSVLSPGAGLVYQQLAGLDPNPIRVGVRVLRQFGFHLLPLVKPVPAELRVWAVPLAVLGFVLVYLLALRWSGGEPEASSTRRPSWWPALFGIGAAGLGYVGLAIVPHRLPLRAQFLSAPGIAVLLAALIVQVTAFVPPRLKRVIPALLASGVVAVGTGRVVAMQHRWQTTSYYDAQRDFLADLVTLAPDLKPHTLVLALDESHTWRASFTFRHAVDYMYQGRAIGHAVGAWDIFYPVRFTPTGVLSEPEPALRGPWRVSADRYGYEEVLVVHCSRERHLSLLLQWPEGILPALPPGARYDPLARILPAGVPPASRRILERPAWPVGPR
jgi:hypothetical protein